MKVLFLVNIPAPYRVDFFDELGKLVDLTVLYERDKASDRNKEWASEKNTNFKEVFLKGIRIRNDAALNPEVTKYLKKDDFDIVVIGGYSTPTGMLAIEYCNLKKIPFILNADGGEIRNEKKLAFTLKRHFISKASAWLSTGHNTTKYLMHYGADGYKVFQYPFTSIREKDLASISPEEKGELKKNLNIDSKPTVLSVGQFIYRKGFDVLLDSWVHLDEFYNLIIIGGGEKKSELEKQIKRLGLKNVTLKDFLKPHELSNYYLASDLFVLPTREDIWGLVVNEAMAHGLPVITTDKCVAGKELIEGNGYIVPINSSDQLAEKIRDILMSADTSLVMSKKSIEIMKNYTIENMAKEHVKIFNTCLNAYASDYLYR